MLIKRNRNISCGFNISLISIDGSVLTAFAYKLYSHYERCHCRPVDHPRPIARKMECVTPDYTMTCTGYAHCANRLTFDSATWSGDSACSQSNISSRCCLRSNSHLLNHWDADGSICGKSFSIDSEKTLLNLIAISHDTSKHGVGATGNADYSGSNISSCAALSSSDSQGVAAELVQ